MGSAYRATVVFVKIPIGYATGAVQLTEEKEISSTRPVLKFSPRGEVLKPCCCWGACLGGGGPLTLGSGPPLVGTCHH